MKEIILYIAASLDGYIADADNKIDWLTVYNGSYGYQEFLRSVDTVLMGRKTYEEVVRMGIPNPHPDQMNFIFTRNIGRWTDTDNIHFTSDDPVLLAKKLKTREGKNIFLVGGGIVIAQLLEHGLIDEIILFIVPVILGKGIPLFNEISHRAEFSTISARPFEDGMIEICLKKKIIHR